MEFGSALFLLSFLLCLGIVGVKVYNVMWLGKFYGFRLAVLGFLAYFVFWLVGFVSYLGDFENLVMLPLFKLSNWFILLNVGLFLAELIMLIKDVGLKRVESYKSKQGGE